MQYFGDIMHKPKLFLHNMHKKEEMSEISMLPDTFLPLYLPAYSDKRYNAIR